MRILVISDLPPFVTGGAEMQASRLVSEWVREGHEVRCLGRRLESGTWRIESHSVALHRIRHLRAAGRVLRGVTYGGSLAMLLLRHAPWADVIYTRFLGEAAATVAALKSVGLVRAPLVATPANTGGAGDVAFLRSLPGSSAVVRLLDRGCDAINLIAPAMESELRAAGFTRVRFARIPNGVPLPPTTARGARNDMHWVSVGRVAHQKGYDLLLSALALAADRIDTRISIAGDGPERVTLERRSRELGLADRVAWLGERSQNEIATLLASATAFVLPSRYEGMSNAALEAMAAGLPLLVTACGGIDRYVDDECGFVVPPGNVEALADGLVRLQACTRRQCLEMGANARQRVEREFDMTVIARRYTDLFHSLVLPSP